MSQGSAPTQAGPIAVSMRIRNAGRDTVRECFAGAGDAAIGLHFHQQRLEGVARFAAEI